MRKVGAWLLELRDKMEWPEARDAASRDVRQAVRAWIESKGGTPGVAEGTYRSEDDSRATFKLDEAVDGDRSWSMARLDETTADGRKFSALVSVTSVPGSVQVYVSMEVGTDATQVNAVEADPHCPKLVRTLLRSGPRWFHGATQLRTLQVVRGFDEGEGLAAEILNADRTVPVLVVSETATGDVALPRLDEKLADDLAGLVNVVRADAEATWALTDQLGSKFQCFDGAVRLYWPGFRPSDDRFRHPLWTANRLLDSPDSAETIRERFRKQLRGRLMTAAATSVHRPREIDSIRDAASRRAIEAMRARANTKSDYEELANSYAEDNDKLRSEREKLKELVDQLRQENAALLTRAENAEILAQYQAPAAPTVIGGEIAPSSPADDEGDLPPPESGETRFYKKVHDTGNHDVMIRVPDCGCANWQSAHKADKARKGIAKLEGGRNDWKNMQHCGSCTGGGMWKVRW